MTDPLLDPYHEKLATDRIEIVKSLESKYEGCSDHGPCDCS